MIVSDPGTLPPASIGGLSGASPSVAVPGAVAVAADGPRGASGPGEENRPPVVGGSLAEPIAAAVLACPLVTRLTGHLAGEVATYLPGRRVLGVRVRPDGIAVQVAGRYGVPVGQIAADVRAAVRAVLADPSSVPSPAEGHVPVDVPIDVVIDDLDMAEEVVRRQPAGDGAAIPPAPDGVPLPP